MSDTGEEKVINGHPHILYNEKKCSPKESCEQSSAFLNLMRKRRSVRAFSGESIPPEVIQHIISTAASAPSGANKQPWHFEAIANSEIKRGIRIAAEKEERENYAHRMSEQWLEDLEPIGTDANKPFLENAPWLIAVFKKVYEQEGEKKLTNYYVNESVGIACGFLISAIHNAGLVTLPHTPSPMNFLADILHRPKNERAFLLFPVGYPAEKAFVPKIAKKSMEEISNFKL